MIGKRLGAMLLATSATLAVHSSITRAFHATAAEPSSAPTTETTEPQQMQVRIVDVQGRVRVRTAPDQPWQEAKVDMVVGENAAFRTGPRSSVTCTIPPDQTFTLDRLGEMSILEAIQDGKTVKTDLAMKYGRVRYDIEAAGVEHRSIIRSPSSTLAVRGTDVVLYDQPPFLPTAESFHGRAQFGYAKQNVSVGGKAYAMVAAGSSGAAETSLTNSVVDPRTALARSETDQQLIANEISRGAVLSFDQTANIAVLKGGAGPLPDSIFAQNAPGALNFFMRWTGNADLNLTVTLEKGDATAILLSSNFQPTELLYPGFSLNNTPSGGHIAFDHRGGPNGGTEVGYWPTVVPGLYGLGATNISGDTTDFKFNVTEDGKPITIFTEALTKGKQIERKIAPGQTIVGIVLIPENGDLEALFPDDPGPTTSTPSSLTVSSNNKTNRRRSVPASAQMIKAPMGPQLPMGPAAKARP